MRRLVVRFELGEGLHIYSDPVPEGMIPTTVSVEGPPGLVVEDAIVPPTETLHLKGLDLELQVVLDSPGHGIREAHGDGVATEVSVDREGGLERLDALGLGCVGHAGVVRLPYGRCLRMCDQ